MAQKALKNETERPAAKQVTPPVTPIAASDGEPLGIESFQVYDRMRAVNLSKLTVGLSPGALATAYFDWAFHLASAPGKQMELGAKAARKWQRLSAWHWSSTMDPETPPVIEPLPGDRRFAHEAWSKLPFNQLAQTFLLQQQWLHSVTHDVPGQAVALTPGKVVYRNHLIELIQYSPTTDTVHPEPVLIVPAWIMKYYILDLSPQNSQIKWLVGQGHTVFAISWRNPDASDRDLEMDDYRSLGVMAALDQINAIQPHQKVHGVGYCLGGTLLSIAAAAMAGQGDDRLASLTLLAAQVDFTEPGELGLFIDPSQLHFLDSMMWNRGYLSADQMAGAFQLLRSNDLIGSRMVREYMMGERAPMFDLMAWNADSTRMPWRMHSEYLRRLYLENELSSGRFTVEGRTVLLQNIRVPVFAVATERDHVAPWESVYKIHQFTDCDVTFALTSGGHNVGIVTPPDHPRRVYRLSTKAHDAPLLSERSWMATNEPIAGSSWWLPWQEWLAGHSSKPVAPPATGKSLADAPGTYVHQK